MGLSHCFGEVNKFSDDPTSLSDTIVNVFTSPCLVGKVEALELVKHEKRERSLVPDTVEGQRNLWMRLISLYYRRKPLEKSR